MDYETWYEVTGYRHEEDIKDWLASAPEECCIEELIGDDIDMYIYDYLQNLYMHDYSDMVDRMYDEYQEKELLEGHCF
jgi:hypothetical protein